MSALYNAYVTAWKVKSCVQARVAQVNLPESNRSWFDALIWHFAAAKL